MLEIYHQVKNKLASLLDSLFHPYELIKLENDLEKVLTDSAYKIKLYQDEMEALKTANTNLLNTIIKHKINLEGQNMQQIIYEAPYELLKFPENSSAYDVRCVLDSEELSIAPGQVIKITTGVKIDMTAMKRLFYMVVPRSSCDKISDGAILAIANTIGVIDNNYQGELFLKIHNIGSKPLILKNLDRIAQILFFQTPEFELVKGTVSDTSDRGSNGDGSTGK